MKEIILNYTHYNLWANRLISEVLLRVPDEQARQEMGGSFSSLQKTAEHVWVAECIWLQRLHMVEQVMVPSQASHGDMGDLCKQWLQCSEGLDNFATDIRDDRGLEHTFHYYNMAGEHQKSTVWECLHHVCNHSTFHRGQMVTLLRQLGISKIPSTDLITYYRKR